MLAELVCSRNLNTMVTPGKGICMFAGNNSIASQMGGSVRLIVAGLFLSVAGAASLQPSDQSERVSSPQIQPSENDKADTDRHIARLGEVNTNEWELDLALPPETSFASSADADLALPDEKQQQKLQRLISDLASSPEDTTTLAELDTLLTEVLGQVSHLIEVGAYQGAAGLLAVIQSIDPNLNGFKTTQKRLLDLKQADVLMEAAQTAIEARKFVDPAGDNAVYYFNKTLQIDPQSQLAQQGLKRVQDVLVQLALDSARELDFEMADAWLVQAGTVPDQQKLVLDARAEVARIQLERAMELELLATAAMESGNFDLAEFHLIDLVALGGQEHRIKSLRQILRETRYYSGFEPGQVFSDPFLRSQDKGPEVVIIAAGSFLMGSPEKSASADASERPRHRVTMRRGFALGVREVTVAEFRLFVERSGHQTAADHAGSSTVYDEVGGRLNTRVWVNWEHDYRGKKAGPGAPVLHIDWHDAKAYVAWLARETGKRYRLPTEAEYEFVARAGGNDTYWWGEGSPAEVVENLKGERDKSPNKRRWTTAFRRYGDTFWGPAPAGSFADSPDRHPMGVHDIAGNVSEWTEDCWHQNYIQAPVDGSAWVNPGCKRTVVRGGYWGSAPAQSRAAFRISAKQETFGPVVGIRIARDL